MTYIHSFNHIIQYIYLLPFAVASLHILIACKLSGKNLPEVPSEHQTRTCFTASRRATKWATPHHNQLSHAAPYYQLSHTALIGRWGPRISWCCMGWMKCDLCSTFFANNCYRFGSGFRCAANTFVAKTDDFVKIGMLFNLFICYPSHIHHKIAGKYTENDPNQIRCHTHISAQPRSPLCAVFRIRRIRKFLDLPDPDSDPLVRGMGPDPGPDPSIIKKK